MSACADAAAGAGRCRRGECRRCGALGAAPPCARAVGRARDARPRPTRRARARITS
ncbi:hypothetical protein GLE_1892 [Lysobacter enzymogenes]|uniref:Uncharacterized protein n=1 Tax=Lysobacter enzymogenes TaxID=69 RepID=A0A0S2DF30_LYSEN|nr:hypothetical protein GLE_1892 [Lysobacter enzymogenes]